MWNDCLGNFEWSKSTFFDVASKRSYTLVLEKHSYTFQVSEKSVNLLEAGFYIEREQQLLLKLPEHTFTIGPQRET